MATSNLVMRRLPGKVALITGGASGIGAAVARRLASEGAQIVVSDVSVEAGRAFAARGGYTFVEHDVTAIKQWHRVISRIKREHKKLNILVNAAGIIGPVGPSNMEKLKVSEWRNVFSVNVEGVLLGCHCAIPLMAESGGTIVNVSSVAALCATPQAVAYGASKAAVTHMTRSLAQYCADRGWRIRCNSVHPSAVRTPMMERYAAKIAREQSTTVEKVFVDLKKKVPLGDLVSPDDVAAAVAFFACDDSRLITGTKLIVDGGATNGQAGQ